MDQLNVSANERIDLADFQMATNTVPAGLVNELTSAFLVNQGQNWVVSGFAPSIVSTPLGVQVGDNVTPNVGLLGQRIGGTISYDVLCVAGPTSQTVALTSFAAGTYGLFVRFARNPGAAAQRVYWDGTNAREYTQLTNTRNVAQFEVRVESVSPSGEWLQIASLTITSTSGTLNATVTDLRPLYFEGTNAGGYAPTWGTTADRLSNRLTKPIADLRTMIDALKAAIVDIKGPGYASWYSTNVQGMNIGQNFTGGTVTPNQLTVGDSKLYLNYSSGAGYTSYTLNIGNGQFSSSNLPGTPGLQLNVSGSIKFQSSAGMQLAATNFVLNNGTAINPLYPECQAWASGYVNNIGQTIRSVGNKPTSSSVNAGVFLITFASSTPTGAFVLTQPVSDDASAVGFSSFGVTSGANLTVRMSRGSTTVSTTPSGFYYCIIYGS